MCKIRRTLQERLSKPLATAMFKLPLIENLNPELNQMQIIERLWQVKKGSSAAWKEAYAQPDSTLHDVRLGSYEFFNSKKCNNLLKKIIDDLLK
jgi:hypothetical protein